METIIKQKKAYNEVNSIARSPTLQTVLMVERFIDENSGEYAKTQLFNNLPKKVMIEDFEKVLAYDMLKHCGMDTDERTVTIKFNNDEDLEKFMVTHRGTDPIMNGKEVITDSYCEGCEACES